MEGQAAGGTGGDAGGGKKAKTAAMVCGICGTALSSDLSTYLLMKVCSHTFCADCYLLWLRVEERTTPAGSDGSFPCPMCDDGEETGGFVRYKPELKERRGGGGSGIGPTVRNTVSDSSSLGMGAAVLNGADAEWHRCVSGLARTDQTTCLIRIAGYTPRHDDDGMSSSSSASSQLFDRVLSLTPPPPSPLSAGAETGGTNGEDETLRAGERAGDSGIEDLQRYRRRQGINLGIVGWFIRRSLLSDRSGLEAEPTERASLGSMLLASSGTNTRPAPPLTSLMWALAPG